MDLKQALAICTQDPEQLRELDPPLFEAVVAELLAGFGWEVSVTPPTRDGGYDILGITTDPSGLQTSWVVECKRYSAVNKVGVDVARQIVGVKTHIGVPNAVLVTTSSFTSEVQQLSSARRDLHLVDLTILRDWLGKYPPPTESSHTAIRSFSSCFISHSSKDEEFTQKLAAMLRAEGVNLWYAPEDIRPGEKILDQVKKAIATFDKLLVVLSENSMKSSWVKTELANALARQQREGTQVLFPVSLVPIDVLRKWECFDSDSGIDIAKELRSYHILDFSNWSDEAAFERQLVKVVKALREGNLIETNSPTATKAKKARDPIIQRRLSAIDVLWSGVLDLESRLYAPVFFYSILIPSEYDSVLGGVGRLSDLVESITDELIADSMRRVNGVEKERPYLGEVLWLQFFVYRAFLGRLATLIVMGKHRQHIVDWRDDDGIRQILTPVFKAEELRNILATKDNPNVLNLVLNKLKSMMLDQIGHLSSAG